MKSCIDCKFCEEKSSGLGVVFARICRHAVASTLERKDCSAIRAHPQLCGPDARYFIDKNPAALPPPDEPQAPPMIVPLPQDPIAKPKQRGRPPKDNKDEAI